MKPHRIFLRIILVIAMAEVISMVLLPHLGVQKGSPYVILDTALLLLLSAPFIHLWVVNGAVRESSLGWQLTKSALEREEDLRQRTEASERHFRDLVHGVDAIVYEADPSTGQFSFVSEHAEAVLGYPAQRWLAGPDFWGEILHSEDRDRATERRRFAMALGTDLRFGYRMIAADGRVVEVQDSMRVVRDADGRPQQVRGLITGYPKS